MWVLCVGVWCCVFFFWDYPPIEKLSPPAEYLAFAQCAFGAKWQKYTGLLSSAKAARFTAKYFQHATCVCKGHDVLSASPASAEASSISTGWPGLPPAAAIPSGAGGGPAGGAGGSGGGASTGGQRLSTSA